MVIFIYEKVENFRYKLNKNVILYLNLVKCKKILKMFKYFAKFLIK